ncbi:MAG: hypothetical protein LiPW16_465 [Microgenomates group bacterium LiPW_16]|nr:MAG: hypothetical protein LiPW16_465 [Microgenomates group bacterium LiPW_16]
MKNLKKAVLSTLAYADVFDYPLSASEVWKFLIGHPEIKADDVQKALLRINADLKLIDADGKFFFSLGRQKIVNLRKKREQWSQKKMKIARRVAKWLKLVPTIKMVAVTGALAMGNSDKDDDIDLLIVTSKNRLWLTRLLTVILVELVTQRRRPQDTNVKDKICLNMFLDENHLRVPKKEQDLFSAHEVCQMRVLCEKDGVYKRFLEENRWVKQFLPNWKP